MNITQEGEEQREIKPKSLAEKLMYDPSIYKKLGEVYKGWHCTVDKEGIKLFKPKEDGKSKK